jgi:hypothetical protein
MHEMKKKVRMIILAAIFVVGLIAVGSYFYIRYQTFDYIEITKSYKNRNVDNANYKQCLGGVVRYSRDGIAFLSETGEEIWKQSCQMNHPVIATCGNSVAVGDKGGTSILVFNKKGLKGEIQTTRPIEKFSVSSQGIVSAILKDEEAPLVMCYDAVGNVVVEHVVSLNTMGYPIDVTVSPDGKTQIVSYLYTEKNEITTKVAYFYYGDTDSDNKQVLQKEFRNTVIPTTAFLNDNVSVLVADNAIYFYKGLEKPEEVTHVNLTNEIQSVACGKDLVVVVLKSDKNSSYQLKAYNQKGIEVISVDEETEYAKMQVVDGRIILYDAQSCSIYNKSGICKFKGNVEENILEIFPISGLNKYMMINASGFFEIQLAK